MRLSKEPGAHRSPISRPETPQPRQAATEQGWFLRRSCRDACPELRPSIPIDRIRLSLGFGLPAAFIVLLAFPASRFASRNDSCRIFSVCMNDHKQPIRLRLSEGQISIFIVGVVGIKKRYREGISEHGGGFLKGNLMRF